MLDYLPIDLPGESYTKLNQRLNKKEYVKICKELTKNKYSVVKASEALELYDKSKIQIPDKVRIIWIHDVERPSENWLAEEMARLENKYGFSSTFNIRTFCAMTEELRKPLLNIIKLGGEIQYQYEDLVAARGNVGKARVLFKKNLAYLRKFFRKINTAFAHGVWLSGIDSTKQFYTNNEWDPALWIERGIHKNGELYYFIKLLRGQFKEKFHYIGESRCLGASEFVSALRKTKPGDIVMFLQHPTWWTDIIDIKKLKYCFRESIFFKKAKKSLG